MEQKKATRDIDINQQKVWLYNVEKENCLRLKWFKTNEERLEGIANRDNIFMVSQEVKEEFKQNLKSNLVDMERKGKKHIGDLPPILVDPDALKSIMKPVDKETKSLLYASTQNDGRINYLTKRIKIIPENRYYFPETTSFNYGWHMWDSSKDKPVSKKFVRQQVIKESFYRRRGVDKDPDWYKEPAKLSPNVCGCI